MSSDSSFGGIMANESFKADTVVDVNPYTPEDWHPNYGTGSYIPGGVPTIFVDLTGHENQAVSAIRIQNAIVQKNGM